MRVISLFFFYFWCWCVVLYYCLLRFDIYVNSFKVEKKIFWFFSYQNQQLQVFNINGIKAI